MQITMGYYFYPGIQNFNSSSNQHTMHITIKIEIITQKDPSTLGEWTQRWERKIKADKCDVNY